MKLFWVQMKPIKVSEFIKFCMTFSIYIYLTWNEDDFFNGKSFFATITTQPDSKITSEEKERLIKESTIFKILKEENL